MFTNRPAMKKETITPIQKNQTKTSQLESDFFKIRDAVQKNLLSNNKYDNSMDADQLRSIIEESYNQVLEDENILYNNFNKRTDVEMGDCGYHRVWSD